MCRQKVRQTSNSRVELSSTYYLLALPPLPLSAYMLSLGGCMWLVPSFQLKVLLILMFGPAFTISPLHRRNTPRNIITIASPTYYTHAQHAPALR
ncbi:hypothetical protein F5X98DRAFT_126001 [Xylaria grammica]|nr:hypothetical protein F5X98DRAFT_126001 [Xylaria grammica]